MTLMEQAQKNIVTKEVEDVSKYEQVSTDFILKGLSEGTIVNPFKIKFFNKKQFKNCKSAIFERIEKFVSEMKSFQTAVYKK